MTTGANHSSAIAIVGMACRLPGARDVREYWRNLRDGVESVRPLDREELLKAGRTPAELLDPHLVPVGALIDDVDLFDAAFFGFTSREAELMDPQHRVFLECASQALEDAGYDPARYDGAISVFGGGLFNSYLTRNLVPGGVFDDKAGVLQTILANEKDYMVSRVAYKLNLRGVACNVQTGCSTSLVAIHLACQSLLNYESDMALAGGVAIDLGRAGGYYSYEGSVFSPDGHCRAFDAEARGTVFGNGAGLVVLKRLEDAIADGDTVRGLVLGTAVNNDGSLKVGFTAPSLTGQTRVIAEALADAGVPPDTIGYVETHGTGTALGDPIEMQAMIKAFGPSSSGVRCPVGSVKTNIGHIDAAAGVAGVIKTILALQHHLIPATLHYNRPNPQLEIEGSRFYIANRPIPWTSGAAVGVPRRAGVSSFGMGGTNAHLVIEEAPAVEPSPASRPSQLVVLSARSASALETATEQLATFLESDAAPPLADVAYTLRVGRSLYAHRRAVVCGDRASAVASLRNAARMDAARFDGRSPRIAFMFSGQGSQYPGMARGLYENEPVFRREFDRCARAVAPELDLLALVTNPETPPERLAQTASAQPALFAVSYALAQLWRHWGVEPEALIGHSVGEYVAATVAGVFTPEDAMRLVLARGLLMQQMPAGAMTAVALPADRCAAELEDGLEVAAVNAPSLCVVAGHHDALASFERRLREAGVESRRLHTSHAFHSAAMDPIVAKFAQAVSSVTRRTPQRRFVSNVTGTWITDAEATSADYWARHLRQRVLFANGLATLLADGTNLFLEVGPGRTLGTLARLQTPGATVAASLPAAQERVSDHEVLLQALGHVWARGAEISWDRFQEGERRRRVPLPTYPFERVRYWVEPDEEEVERKRALARANEKNPDISQWLYARGWRETPPLDCLASAAEITDPPGCTIVLSDGSALASRVIQALETRDTMTRVMVAPVEADAEHYERVIRDAADAGAPVRIVHFGNAAPAGDRAAILSQGFHSFARLGGALDRYVKHVPVSLKVVTANTEDVTGLEPIDAVRATVAGICLVLPQEQPNVRCERIDVSPRVDAISESDDRALVSEILGDAPDVVVAIRGGRRWVPAMERLTGVPRNRVALRRGGHYLIVGGFGTVGFSLACGLAQFATARLSLIGRRRLPDRSEWQRWVDTHPADEPTTVLVRRAAYLDRIGTEYLSLTADAADAAQLGAAVAEAEARFGPINGVISAAGLMDESAFAPIRDLDLGKVDRHFRPKLDGLPALDLALAGKALDFCIITSSLSTVLGGVGYSTYAAANCYQDAYVRQHNRTADVPWAVINWDAWHPPGGEMPATSLLARLAMTTAEGVSAFARLLQYRGLVQAYVATADLPARIDRWTKPDRQKVVAMPEGVGADSSADSAQESFSPTERAVITIWQQVLGIGFVDLHDRFLDLGGSSLTAIQVIERIESELGVRITIEEFIFQTAAQLASICDARRMAPAETAAVAGTEAAPDVAAAGAAAGGTGWSRIRGILRGRGTDEGPGAR
jgi:acyl transferase domain-containing protein/acyl carrier protein